MPNSAPVSVVLLGYGLAGRVFHAPLIEAADGLRLDAIVTGNPDRAAEASRQHPNATIYATPGEAWSSGHDLAVIGTPNISHVPFATAALNAGMHVVVDKPVASTAAATQELAALASDVERMIIPFHNRRWDSDFRTACAAANSGAIGTVHRFESQISKMRVQPKDGWRNSSAPAEMGGQLYDLGAHLIDQALMLMGPAVRVWATARSVRDSQDADDDTCITIEHASGAVSRLVVSQVTAFPEPRITLLGTRGGVRIDGYDQQEPALASGSFPAPGTSGIEAWGEQGGHAILRSFDDASVLTESLLPMERGGWPEFYDGVGRCLIEGAEPPVLISDVVADMRVMDAARDSAATGESVILTPPAGHRAPAIA